MASGLSDERREQLEKIASMAEHYPMDSDEMNMLDGGGDLLRKCATLAQELLDKNTAKP